MMLLFSVKISNTIQKGLKNITKTLQKLSNPELNLDFKKISVAFWQKKVSYNSSQSSSVSEVKGNGGCTFEPCNNNRLDTGPEVVLKCCGQPVFSLTFQRGE